MSTNYILTVNGSELSTVVNQVDYELKVDSQDYNLALARTGGQGSRGNSVTSADINSSNELLITISDSAGTVTEVLNAGSLTPSIEEFIPINALTDVTVTAAQDGDIIQYNATSGQFVNHTLTTNKIVDIDNTNKADGAVLVYNGSNSKYAATTTINNANTTIIGGSF